MLSKCYDFKNAIGKILNFRDFGEFDHKTAIFQKMVSNDSNQLPAFITSHLLKICMDNGPI